MSNKVAIIVGSVLGATEYVAEAVENCLKNKGYEPQVFLTPNIDDIPTDVEWLICTSTHGAGDLPDNIIPFAKSLNNVDLSSNKARIIGLGDSSYDTYCYGAMTMEKKLIAAGSTLVTPVHTIDVLHHPIPEDEAVKWVNENY